MKYTKIESFEKHLNEALPEHFSNLYFIFLESPCERLFIAKQIAKKLGYQPVCCEDVSLIEESGPSLFSDKKVFICDEPKEKQIAKRKDVVVIFTGKKAPSFYKTMEKEGTTLDLSEEKPWDRRRRLQRWLIDYAFSLDKCLSPEAALSLIDAFYPNFGRLFRELEKIVAYSGEKKRLTIDMMQDVSFLQPVSKGWQLSERMIVGGRFNLSEETLDPWNLIGQLRYYLQLGLEVTAGRNRLDIPDKKIEIFRQSGLPFAYFVEGLKDLLQLEINIRLNHGSKLFLFFDQFRAKLEMKRERFKRL